MMRPATVHALAQAIRHGRGLLATLEKWLAATPPEQVAGELAIALAAARGALWELNTTLGRPRSSTAPAPASRPNTDRPAAQAARSSRPDGL
jgi:hypothetical protein